MNRRCPKMLMIAFATTLVFAQGAGQLVKEAGAAFGEKRYVRAAELFMKVFDQDTSDASTAYNAACCYALAGNGEAAFRCLDRALQAGFSDADNAASDTDLEHLHADARWAGLLDRMRTKKARVAAFWEAPALTSGYREQLSEDERIAGLSRFWSEVKYNFWNTDRLVEIDWDRLYLTSLARVRAAASTAEYYRILTELCAQLKDGHTNVWAAPELRERSSARPLFSTRLMEGRVLVTDVFDETLRAKGVLPGVEVTSVDGQPSKAYAETRLAPYQSASTPQDLGARIYSYAFLAGPSSESPLVEFANASGKHFTLKVPRVDAATRKKVVAPTPGFDLRMLPGQVAYVRLNSFNDNATADQFLASFPEIAKAKALILDVRENGGGNSGVGQRILATLADHPFSTSTWSTRDYKPAFRAWGRPEGVFHGDASLVPNDPARHFGGAVVLLTGPSTYSAAEDFAVAFDLMRRGLILGEPTGGSTGQPLGFKLPGGGEARVCTKLDTYPDGRAFVGVGVQPGRLVHPTVADFRKGRDTLLEAALRELSHPVGD